jgi:hypothetical protein
VNCLEQKSFIDYDSLNDRRTLIADISEIFCGSARSEDVELIGRSNSALKYPKMLLFNQSVIIKNLPKSYHLHDYALMESTKSLKIESDMIRVEHKPFQY